MLEKSIRTEKNIVAQKNAASIFHRAFALATFVMRDGD